MRCLPNVAAWAELPRADVTTDVRRIVAQKSGERGKGLGECLLLTAHDGGRIPELRSHLSLDGDHRTTSPAVFRNKACSGIPAGPAIAQA